MLFWFVAVVIATGGYVHGSLETVPLEPLPEKTNYSASGVEYHDGGMGPMFDFARSFINSALPGDFPTEFINETMHQVDNGELDVGSLAKKLLKRFAGYVAALVVGVLFVIVVPIVGCCFCGCRICGKCGGKRKQDVTSHMNRNRWIYSAVMFALAVFTLTGNICTYVSNNRISAALDGLGDTVADNMNDIDDYLDLVQRQVEVIGVKNLHTTETSILGHMDATKLKKEISEYVLNSLSGGALTTMDAHINATRLAFNAVAAAAQRVHVTFTRARSTCTANVCGVIPNRDPLTASSQFDAIISNFKPRFDSFAQNSVVERVTAQLTSEVGKHLLSVSAQRIKIQAAFTRTKTTVNDIVQNVKDFRTKAKDGIDIEDYKTKAKKFTADVNTYDTYRYAAGAGLSAIATLVVVFQLLGLAFGVVGHSSKQKPTHRGCVTNAGGNMLIASVAFIFLFAPLLMLLTTVCFSLGSILERFACQPLSDPSLQVLDLADPYLSTRSSLDAEFSTVIKRCRDGESAYKAFNLRSKFDLNTIDTKLHDEEKKIDKSFGDTLTGLNTISQLDFSTATGSLADLSASLDNIDFRTITNQLSAAVHGLQHGVSGSIDRYLTEMNALTVALQNLEISARNVGNWSITFKHGMQEVSKEMTAKITPLMHTFKEKILDIAHRYVNSTKADVEFRLGKCTPLWNLYHSIVVVSVCKHTLDAFNGFWFSIGWCLFFFVPSIVIATKLAKHYRRMDEEDDHTPFKEGSSIGYSSPAFRSNKVAHVDDPAR